jgi:lipopolysaccharide transport system permease protein
MQKENWDFIIDKNRSTFDFKLLWNYRDLLLMFVKRDIISFYKQTILGPLWFFIQPVMTTIVFTLIFGKIAGISTDGVPQPLFYLAGITCWNYFSDCIIKTSTVFKDNQHMFGKVYFPRLITPLSIVLSNLVKFFLQFCLFISVLIYYKYIYEYNINVTYKIILFPLLIVMMSLLSLGIGLIVTALTTKYKDLSFLINFGVQLMMYCTTVIYPYSQSPDNFKKIILLNPMTAIIESFRYIFLGRGSVSLNMLIYSVISTLLLLIIGVTIFNKTEKDFIDTI